MKFVRILFPFLFVLNWYEGRWELSSARLGLFLIFLGLFAMATTMVIVLQAPVEYSAST